MESLYEDAPCGYFSMRLDGTIVRVNRTMLRWTRYTADDLVLSRKFQHLLTIGGQIFYETHYAPLLAIQGSVSELALDIVRSDRSIFPALVNSTLRRDLDGRPQLVRTMVFDASERRSYERELLLARREAERAAREKSGFVAMLSHDLRSPLTAIMNVADLLIRDESGRERERYLALLRSGAQTAMELVKAVLTSSQLESGKMPLDLSIIDLPDLVSQTVEQLRLQADRKGLQLWFNVDERIPGTLLGDSVKLCQILANLLGNAIKYTERGWVGLTAALAAPITQVAHVEVTVMDTGIGIDPARLSQVFDEFTQVHDRSARNFGGVGLGLSITKKLVELHGGTISVENRPQGGAQFRCSLQLQVPESSATSLRA